ncbi:MAG: hypothetical protein M0R69_07550 [Candidatus Cloacimonetes bacterium]|nr:hypothetical protein [Candidatus Cloacimonadota bacterium]
MGTQQILLIVLSVIIVGAAIAVGIQMFNSQAYSANKSAVAADAQSFATQVIQYYKTPTSQGGAGRSAGTGDGELMSPEKIAEYIGWGAEVDTTTTDTGTYKIAVGTLTSLPAELAGSTFCITITGVGNETKGALKPKVVTTVGLPVGKISAAVTDK